MAACEERSAEADQGASSFAQRAEELFNILANEEAVSSESVGLVVALVYLNLQVTEEQVAHKRSLGRVWSCRHCEQDLCDACLGSSYPEQYEALKMTGRVSANKHPKTEQVNSDVVGDEFDDDSPFQEGFVPMFPPPKAPRKRPPQRNPTKKQERSRFNATQRNWTKKQEASVRKRPAAQTNPTRNQPARKVPRKSQTQTDRPRAGREQAPSTDELAFSITVAGGVQELTATPQSTIKNLKATLQERGLGLCNLWLGRDYLKENTKLSKFPTGTVFNAIQALGGQATLKEHVDKRFHELTAQVNRRFDEAAKSFVERPRGEFATTVSALDAIAAPQVAVVAAPQVPVVDVKEFAGLQASNTFKPHPAIKKESYTPPYP